MTLVFLIAGLAISTLMAFFQKKSDTEVSPITQVAVVDESGLEVLYLDGFKEAYGEKYPSVSFVESSEGASLTVKITQTEEGYLLTAVLPYESELSEGDAVDFLDDFTVCMEQ